MSGEGAQTRSKRYSSLKTRFFISDLVLSVIALGAFQLLLARPVSNLAFDIHPNFYFACFIYITVFLAFMYAVSFPLNIANSFFLERAFNLSRQGFKTWLWDEVKSVALSFGLSMFCIQLFYLLIRRFPQIWWLIAALGWILFTIVLARFLPVLLIPLFYKYSPIKDEALRKRIMDLAGRSGIQLMDVCQIDFSRKTSKANAALVGLGKTRKVILADTLMQEFLPEEIEAVVAHEFGHCKYRHIWQLLMFSAIMTVAGFFVLSLLAGEIVVFTGATGLSDLYIFPILVFSMTAFGIIILPVQNLFSRILERQSDRFALEMTEDSGTFISMMKKLASTNLAEMEPSTLKKIFMYDHPPVGERIRMAEGYKIRDEG
ncbi:M48 family metallopeptidase [Candidatus Omnitrophota bacterium]